MRLALGAPQILKEDVDVVRLVPQEVLIPQTAENVVVMLAPQERVQRNEQIVEVPQELDQERIGSCASHAT